MMTNSDSYRKDRIDMVKTVEALRRGDHRAYNQIFELYFDKLLEFMTATLYSTDEAEDIVQRAFIDLWEKREILDPEKSIKGFLFTTARFYTLSVFKRNKVKERYINSITGEVFADSPDELLEAQEIDIVIRMAIENMPAQRQRVIRMSLMEGLSTEEIANKLKLKVETVRTHIMLGKRDIDQAISLFILLFMLM